MHTASGAVLRRCSRVVNGRYYRYPLQESDESDSDSVQSQEMERPEDELEEEAAEEADQTVGYNSPPTPLFLFLLLSDIVLCRKGGGKAEPPMSPAGCGRALICTALHYKYTALWLCHCSCMQPLPENIGRLVRKRVSLFYPAGRESSWGLFTNKQLIKKSISVCFDSYHSIWK